MSIIIDEKLVAIWQLDLSPTSDYLGGLRELKADELYEFTFRFRYYVDDKVFDSNDVKNWYAYRISDNRAKTLATIRGILGAMQALGAVGEVDELLAEGLTPEQFMEKMASRSWCHYEQEGKHSA